MQIDTDLETKHNNWLNSQCRQISYDKVSVLIEREQDLKTVNENIWVDPLDQLELPDSPKHSCPKEFPLSFLLEERRPFVCRICRKLKWGKCLTRQRWISGSGPTSPGLQTNNQIQSLTWPYRENAMSAKRVEELHNKKIKDLANVYWQEHGKYTWE